MQNANWIVGSAGGLVLVWAFARKAGASIKIGLGKFKRLIEALIGRDEIRHPDTGALLVAAQPDLNSRLGNVENAVVRMADATTELARLSHRVDGIAVTLDNHVKESVQERAALWKAVELAVSPSPTATV